MRFLSTRNPKLTVDSATAILGSLAQDGGLYFPAEFPDLSAPIRAARSLPELGEIILAPFFADALGTEFSSAIQAALNFDAPLKTLTPNLYVLELFHGPSLAFKDFGARVMAELMSRLARKQGRSITILTATSGDTGGAVVQAFSGKSAANVVVLYPKGRVSDVQEKQMTTAGGNIQALEVDGSFDDCQAMAKSAFLDPDLAGKNLVSANSINIARLLPQAIYYAEALRQLNFPERATFVVPSGNFGNIFAGMALRKVAFRQLDFVAATNANATFVDFLASDRYAPRPSNATLSNAMDVGDPSNLERIQFLVEHNISDLRSFCRAVSVSDDETIAQIRRTSDTAKYIVCPHTAVGLAAIRKLVLNANGDSPVISLATAHPAKFKAVIELNTSIRLPLPENLRSLLNRTGSQIPIKNSALALKDFLIGNAELR